MPKFQVMKTSVGVGISLFFLFVYFATAGSDEIFIDSLGRKIVRHRPIKRIVALGNYRLEAVKVLGASGRVVGIDTNSKKYSAYYFPKLQHLPEVGTWKEPNFEVIAALQPDLVITSEIAWGLDSIVAAAVWLKWCHSDADIVPEQIYRQYMDRFLSIPYPQNLIFAYPFPGDKTPDP